MRNADKNELDIERILMDLVNVREDPSKIFSLIQPIGSGSYGRVYKAIDDRNGRTCAIKIIPALDREILKSALREIQILSSCKSNYIVDYLGTYMKSNELWIIMEHCEFRSLKKIMDWQTRPFSEDYISAVVYCTLMGINYIHSQKMIHRDVKADNILINETGMAKIADFGVSTQLVSTFGCTNTCIGSPYWMSPESLHNQNYTSKTDIWSLGITCIELSEMNPPRHEIASYKVMEVIKRSEAPNFKNPNLYSKNFQNFVQYCLTVDADERPTAEDLLLQHPFVRSGKNRLHLLKGFADKNLEFYRTEILTQNNLGAEMLNFEQLNVGEVNDGSEDGGSVIRVSRKSHYLDEVSNKSDSENTGTIVYHRDPVEISDNSVKVKSQRNNASSRQSYPEIPGREYSDATEYANKLLKWVSKISKEINENQEAKKLGLTINSKKSSIQEKQSFVQKEKEKELLAVELKYQKIQSSLKDFLSKCEEMNRTIDQLVRLTVPEEKIKAAIESEPIFLPKRPSKNQINQNQIQIPASYRLPTGGINNPMIFKQGHFKKEFIKKIEKKQGNFVSTKNDKSNNLFSNLHQSEKTAESKVIELESYNKAKNVCMKSSKNLERHRLICNGSKSKQKTNGNFLKIQNYLK